MPNATDDVLHVLTVATTEGRLDAPESTGVTRVSYDVLASSPVRVVDVPDVLAENVVQVESAAFLYSTLYPVTPVVSCGAIHERESCEVLPVEAVPDREAEYVPTLLAPRAELLKS